MRWILSRVQSLNEDELHIDIDRENVEYIRQTSYRMRILSRPT